MLKKTFEEKFLIMISDELIKISNGEDSITKNYYNCYNYLNDIIDSIRDIASESLLIELCIQKQFYQLKYLYNKGLL